MARASTLRGKLKGFFFLLRLDIFVPRKIYSFFSHFADLSKWIAKNKKCGHCDFYSFKFDYTKRFGLFDYIIAKENLDSGVDYLEFGVSTGDSFRWWVDRIKHPDAKFYGFDTFSGLPEAWGPYKKGDMNNGNAAPVISGDNRHHFYQGLFQQTLIPFLSNYPGDRRKIVHMDADLYSATLYVLTMMTPYLKPGDIILFDEFNVPLHEYKAFKEWTSAFYIQYEVLGGVNNFYQTAIKLV